MAISNLVETSLKMVFTFIENEKTVEKVKTIKSLNTSLTDDEVYAFGQALQTLQAFSSNISRVDTETLTA